MFLTANEITTNIQWLLENASAPVRYLTRRHLLNEEPDSPLMLELWQDVLQSDGVEEIFSQQRADGTWFSGGPWGPKGYSRKSGYNSSRPKFVTTAWILPFLGEMGFTVDDERIHKSCDAILSEHSTWFATETENCCGLSGIPLRAFASVGMGADQRLQESWSQLLRCQRNDSGWLNPRHLADSPNPSTTKGRWPWDRSCVWGSYYSAQALYYANSSQPAAFKACEFLLWHLQLQNPEHLQTWAYHGHNIVKELLMFSEVGIDMTLQPIQALLGWLKGYYRVDEGMFRTQEKPIPNYVRQVSSIVKSYEQEFGTDYWKVISKTGKNVLRYQLYHLVEDDWLTYYLTRIGLNMSPEMKVSISI